MDEKSNKVKLLVYATEDDRARIKMAAAKLHMSMSQLILDSVLEQVASIEELEKNGRCPGMKTIAVMNQKGGTGKTTSAINLAGELVRRGKKVLIVDMDTQGNATSNLSLTEIPAATLTDVIVSKTATLADTVCHTTTENLDLDPGRQSAGSGAGHHAGDALRPGHHPAPPPAPDPRYLRFRVFRLLPFSGELVQYQRAGGRSVCPHPHQGG